MLKATAAQPHPPLNHPTMALVYYVRNIGDVIRALVANDEMNHHILQHAVDNFNEYEAHHLLKELYLAPYCFVKNYARWGENDGHVIFTPMVPWLNDIHSHVRDEMELQRPVVPEAKKSAEAFLDNVVHDDEYNLYYFANHGYYPTVEDLREKDLYQEVIRVSCAAMKWETPSSADWRKYHGNCIAYYHASSPTIDDFVNFNTAAQFKKRSMIFKDNVIPDENDRYSTPVKRSSYFYNI